MWSWRRAAVIAAVAGVLVHAVSAPVTARAWAEGEAAECKDEIVTPEGTATLIGSDDVELTQSVPILLGPFVWVELERVTKVGYYRLDGELMVIGCGVEWKARVWY